jgi:hypothetical protein
MENLRIYYLRKRRIVFLLAIGELIISILPILFLFFFPTIISRNWIPLSVVFLFFGVITFYYGISARLIVNSRGINCYDIVNFMGVNVDWENISDFYKDKNKFFLILISPGIPNNRFYKWLTTHSWINPLIVDLSSFIDYWNDQDLIKDFGTHLPQLF